MTSVIFRKLERKFVEKVWGVAKLDDRFDYTGDARIGEVWFEPPAELDGLLLKFIFTSERLSVQNHPDDAYAAQSGLSGGGKEECWVILGAEPGATIAAGFKRDVSRGGLRAAALDGSITELLVWHEVKRGDIFHIPAGVVHAIGCGVSLIEIQQNSDVTFRLYDYGRQRELHLEHGVAAAKTGPYPQSCRSTLRCNAGDLIQSEFFQLEALDLADATTVEKDQATPAIIVLIEGGASLGEMTLSVGEAAYVEDVTRADIVGDGILLIVTAKT